ncbi:MAG: glycosyltransferase [Gammaproteobacteria bacterium]|nr:glycosyltransferase [Gammaproteobacteria bacterium]
MDDVIRVFIGYDQRETAAFHVLTSSILTRSSKPVAFHAIALHQLKDIFNRERNPLQSTDFSFSRFLTPYLSGYEGWSVFMDCDMLVLDDISKLFAMRDEKYAVMVVKHKHEPQESEKFLGQPQSKYEKKNWSSVMLFNNSKCKALSPEYVNTASGLELHQFKWLQDDSLIGGLPNTWNHLVGYDQPKNVVSLIHYTIGGPYFKEYTSCEYAEEWFSERDRMLYCEQKEVSNDGHKRSA